MCVILAYLARESNSKETDAAILSIIGRPFKSEALKLVLQC